MSKKKKKKTKKEKEMPLGRLLLRDDRDKSFPMKLVLTEKAKEDYKYWWPSGWWGDQGSSPTCVAYSWIHWLEDGGITQNHKEPPVVEPKELYDAAQRVDQWIGENYDGTSIRAGAKVLLKLGYITEYRWTWDLDEMVQALLTKGPVVVGTNWYNSMFFPDEEGWIGIKPGSYVVGGHAYVLNGVNVKEEKLRIKNSWGRSWGDNGSAWISFEDMRRLMSEYGECCLAAEVKK